MGCSRKDIDTYTELSRDSANGLNRFFSLCSIAHAVTSHPLNVYKVAVGVIKEFYDDNVVYLELRTTPRAGDNMTKEEYVNQVIKAIVDVSAELDIVVKLILSLNRCHSLHDCEESLDLVIKMKERNPDIIKGIDLCGDPSNGTFHGKLFAVARENGLYVTLHCAEVSNENEVKQMLEFKPDRLGHGSCIHPTQGGTTELWELYRALKIPLGKYVHIKTYLEDISSFILHNVLR